MFPISSYCLLGNIGVDTVEKKNVLKFVNTLPKVRKKIRTNIGHNRQRGWTLKRGSDRVIQPLGCDGAEKCLQHECRHEKTLPFQRALRNS